jgi:hypothetical protein
MKVLEILLPKQYTDRSISPKTAAKIDSIQQRINQYVDKIVDPKTTSQGREFLKSRLRDEYTELKTILGNIHYVAESDGEQYEVYDCKTSEKVSGPYATAKRARLVRDKKDLEYGAVRYGVRPVKKLNEAVHRIPLCDEDFDALKEMMCRPIPATIAPIYIQGLIIDDEFTDQIAALEQKDPGMDVRPFIVEWIDRVMPDQMYRFRDEFRVPDKEKGLYSVLHGYDPQSYKGTNDPITGDAFGSR